jgi:hypothetical protein
MANNKTTKVEPQTVSAIPENVDQNMYITVYNGFHGILVYESKKTGETFIWNDFGESQEMELKELRNAKSTHKSFFVNNYFMFDDESKWVIDYLGVASFYEHAIELDGFNEIFTSSPAQIKKIIGNMSEGQKKSLLYSAKKKVADGEVDSLKIIKALEEGLGAELIEH